MGLDDEQTGISGKKVLVVDDNKAIHEDFKKILNQTEKDPTFEILKESLFSNSSNPIEKSLINYNISSAFQGSQALEMVKQAVIEEDPYSVIFVDMRMPPGWDGLQTIEEIWKVSPGAEIVICSAYTDYSWQQILARIGATQNLLILQKPFEDIEVQQLTFSLNAKWMTKNQSRTLIENTDFSHVPEPQDNISALETFGRSPRLKKSNTYHHGDLRNALVLAGLKILRKKGLKYITLKEVSKLLGVSITAPYRHFANKEDLLVALAQEGFTNLGKKIAEIPLLFKGNPKSQLQELGNVYLRFATTNPELFHLMFESHIFAMLKRYPEFERAVRNTFESISIIVKTCQNVGVLKEGSPLRQTLVIWSTMHGLSILAAGNHLTFLGEQLKYSEKVVSELISTLTE